MSDLQTQDLDLLSDGWFDYAPEDGLLPDFFDVDLDSLFTDVPGPDLNDESWSWSDARLISLDRGEDAGARRYEIGCIDVYANAETGDLGASYLPVAALPTQEEAQAVYHELQQQIHEHGVGADYELARIAEEQAFALNPEPENWRGAQPAEYAAYEGLCNLDRLGEWFDEPPDEALDPLIETAIELGGGIPEIGEEQKALAGIGVVVEGFDPVHNPPPFYDTETGTAYWIGVFQPDQEDRENCVTSILSLGRNLETGAMEAQLAPCVTGDWDTAYSGATFLIDMAREDGMDRCFDAAEEIALQSGQRNLWESERGLALAQDTANEIADYTREGWDLDL